MTGDQGHTANGLLASGGLASESEHLPENKGLNAQLLRKGNNGHHLKIEKF